MPPPTIDTLPCELVSEIVEWLDDDSLVMCVLASRVFHVLDRYTVHERGASIRAIETPTDLAQRGLLYALDRMHARGAGGFTAHTMDAAAERGHVGVVRFLADHRGEGCTQKALVSAATGGYADIVALLLDRPSDGHDLMSAFYAAIGSGHIGIAQAIRAHPSWPPSSHNAVRQDVVYDASQQAGRRADMNALRWISSGHLWISWSLIVTGLLENPRATREMLDFAAEHTSEFSMTERRIESTEAYLWAIESRKLHSDAFVVGRAIREYRHDAMDALKRLRPCMFDKTVRHADYLLDDYERGRSTSLFALAHAASRGQGADIAAIRTARGRSRPFVVDEDDVEWLFGSRETDLGVVRAIFADDDDHGLSDVAPIVVRSQARGTQPIGAYSDRIAQIAACREAYDVVLWLMDKRPTDTWECACANAVERGRYDIVDAVVRRRRLADPACTLWQLLVRGRHALASAIRDAYPEVTANTRSREIVVFRSRVWLSPFVDKTFLSDGLGIVPDGRALDAAVLWNRPDVARYLFERHGLVCSKENVRTALASGNDAVLAYLIGEADSRPGPCAPGAFAYTKKSVGVWRRLLDHAVGDGHWQAAERVRRHIGAPVYTARAMDRAAGAGHLKVVMALSALPGSRCTTKAINWASMNGHLDVVDYLLAHRTEGCTTYAVAMAARNGHAGVVRRLVSDDRCPYTDAALINAAKKGHMGVVMALGHLVRDAARSAAAKACTAAHRKGRNDIATYIRARRR